MEFGTTITHPLLRVAVSLGEATIREACARSSELDIHVEMDRFPDGRDGIRVTLRTPGALSGFTMLFQKYLDHEALSRVARHAWQSRVPCADVLRLSAWPALSMN